MAADTSDLTSLAVAGAPLRHVSVPVQIQLIDRKLIYPPLPPAEPALPEQLPASVDTCE